MIDFTVFYKERLPANGPWALDPWDVFISAFNESERVRVVFDKVPSQVKQWVVHEEYGYKPGELPGGSVYRNSSDEAQFVAELLDGLPVDWPTARICVDTTGWMRPHLMVLPLLLMARGVRRFDALYAEPVQYKKQENTDFAGMPDVVRPVLGFEGFSDPDTSNDLLIIGAGYDDALIARAAEHKRSARKMQMFGFPSLRPDMYQENVLRARRAAEAVGDYGTSPQGRVMAPANDPFVVASVLRSAVERERETRGVSNLYLCPLGTKPQALGFALYYLYDCRGKAATMIFPFARSYDRETSVGISSVMRHTVELPGA